MVKQFLLNPDGTMPPNVNASLLEANDIPLVLPTPRWIPREGFTLEERDPVQDAEGVWRQKWVEVEVVDSAPPETNV